LLVFQQLHAQQPAATSLQSLMREITLAKQDSDKAKLQFKLGEYYFDKEGSFKPDLDSGKFYFKQALIISNTFKSPELRNQILKAEGDRYIQNGIYDNAKECFNTVTNFYKKIGDKYNEAKTWDQYGDCIQRAPDLIGLKISCYNQAYIVYNTTPNQVAAITELKKIADMHLVQGKLAQSENELLQVLARFKAIHFKQLQYTYDLLGGVNQAKGNLHMMLFYRLQTVKSMEASGDFSYAVYFYKSLANAYTDVGMPVKSLPFYFTVMNLTKSQKDFDTFYDVLRKCVNIYVVLDETKVALTFLKKQSEETPPVNYNQKEFLNASYGICYEKLGEEKKAEQYYLEMVRDAHFDNPRNELSGNMESYIIITRFYIKTAYFKKAEPYLDELLKLPPFLKPPVLLNELELYKFKTDSADHNYFAAIGHYQLHKRLNDSLSSANQKKLIEVVQLKDESDKKDIAIQLLQKKEQLDHNLVEQSRTMRNILIAGAGMLLLLMALGYNRYRVKQQHNLQLERNQKIISDKNRALEKSLHENEWLLKEVHHRVKNNMQLVSSLLVSQCEFLRDESAITAIMESRHRIQSMSLIHQKLYKTNNVSTIYMPEYVEELVDYFKDSFKIRTTIYFELKIAPIHLDVQQAIPVGLILNEVITNAINHAFPFTENDKIWISFSLVNDEELALTIEDNGKGLPDGFNIKNYKNSFGLLLIKGLTEDIGGSFSIGGTKGTIVNINFMVHREAHNA